MLIFLGFEAMLDERSRVGGASPSTLTLPTSRRQVPPGGFVSFPIAALSTTTIRRGVAMSILRDSQVLKDSRLVASAGICGGAVRIRGTRIAVWGIEAARRLGITTERILDMYPSLTPSDVEAAIGYADSHQSEMNEDISAQHES